MRVRVRVRGAVRLRVRDSRRPWRGRLRPFHYYYHHLGAAALCEHHEHVGRGAHLLGARLGSG